MASVIVDRRTVVSEDLIVSLFEIEHAALTAEGLGRPFALVEFCDLQGFVIDLFGNCIV